MGDRRGADGMGSRALLRVLRRRLGWVLVFAVLAAAGASVYSLLQDEKYKATASIRLEPATTNLEPARREVVSRRTERRFVRSGDISAADAVSSIDVTIPGESDLIEVEATAGNPRTAALVANTFAEELVAPRRTADRTNMVVDRATPPGSPSSPKPVRDTLLGGLAGLLLGIGVALTREKFDRRIRDSEDLEEAFGLPLLARLPDSEALGRRLGLSRDLPPFEAEEFRTLRSNLRHFDRGQTIDSVLVTSASSQDGRSTVALNLAAVAALQADVLLVEAAVRRPTLARSLGLPPEGGLAAVLAGELPFLDACHEVLLVHQNGNGKDAPPTLNVLHAGEWRPATKRLVESERMREILWECRQSYSLVVIDSPPASLIPDAPSLMREVSAVIVVGRVGKLTSEQAARLREQLDEVDAPTLGIVANFAEGSGALS